MRRQIKREPDVIFFIFSEGTAVIFFFLHFLRELLLFRFAQHQNKNKKNKIVVNLNIKGQVTLGAIPIIVAGCFLSQFEHACLSSEERKGCFFF
jgi:undecaprenyl pyrophosphate phosphatase UppP